MENIVYLKTIFSRLARPCFLIIINDIVPNRCKSARPAVGKGSTLAKVCKSSGGATAVPCVFLKKTAEERCNMNSGFLLSVAAGTCASLASVSSKLALEEGGRTLRYVVPCSRLSELQCTNVSLSTDRRQLSL